MKQSKTPTGIQLTCLMTTWSGFRQNKYHWHHWLNHLQSSLPPWLKIKSVSRCCAAELWRVQCDEIASPTSFFSFGNKACFMPTTSVCRQFHQLTDNCKYWYFCWWYAEPCKARMRAFLVHWRARTLRFGAYSRPENRFSRLLAFTEGVS